MIPNPNDPANEPGLTKREMFAMAAMQWIPTRHVDISDMVREAVLMADALIKELNKEKG